MTVWVKPGSSRGPLVEPADPAERGAELVVYLRERAVDGKANAALVDVLAGHLGVPPSQVRIVAGHTARLKRIEIG